MNYVSLAAPLAPMPGGRRQERTRTVIFVAPPETVPERFTQAVESEFPWTVIEEVGHIDEAIRIFPNTVSLILVHPSLAADAEHRADNLFRYHPLALTAVLDDGSDDGAGADRLLASPLIRGVLPIHGRLDVSLSIMALLLRGIEYFPRAAFSAALERPTAPPEPEPEAEPGVPAHLRILTRRELQVLALVERGLQNKSIANDLNLSGHTVKIHLHNIISKLGARNRTEAAALFRGSRRSIAVH